MRLGPITAAALVKETSKHVSRTSSRMLLAWNHAQHLIARAHDLCRTSQKMRAGMFTTEEADSSDDVAWTTPDGLVRCRVVRHSSDEHQVILVVKGDVMWSRTFADPVEATDESARVRRLFLE